MHKYNSYFNVLTVFDNSQHFQANVPIESFQKKSGKVSGIFLPFATLILTKKKVRRCNQYKLAAFLIPRHNSM